jgi:hypothetical protein
MEPLIWELFNSIFDNFAQREMVLNRNNFLTEIFKFKSYYELYHEAHDALEDVSNWIIFFYDRVFNKIFFFV